MKKEMTSVGRYFKTSFAIPLLIFFLAVLFGPISSCSPKLIPYQQEGDSIVVEKSGWRYYKLQHKDIPLEGEHKV